MWPGTTGWAKANPPPNPRQRHHPSRCSRGLSHPHITAHVERGAIQQWPLCRFVSVEHSDIRTLLEGYMRCFNRLDGPAAAAYYSAPSFVVKNGGVARFGSEEKAQSCQTQTTAPQHTPQRNTNSRRRCCNHPLKSQQYSAVSTPKPAIRAGNHPRLTRGGTPHGPKNLHCPCCSGDRGRSLCHGSSVCGPPIRALLVRPPEATDGREFRCQMTTSTVTRYRGAHFGRVTGRLMPADGRFR